MPYRIGRCAEHKYVAGMAPKRHKGTARLLTPKSLHFSFPSLVPERLDRIEMGGAPRREIAEDHADQR
jgi:hypothetical protein